MKIEIDCQKAFSMLQAGNLSHQDTFFLEATKQLRDGEGWKNKDKPEPIERTEFSAAMDVLLPNPFKKIDLDFSRYGESYSSTVRLDTRHTSGVLVFDFSGLSRILENEFSENWYSLDNYGRGYFLESGTPKIIVGGDGHSYGIGAYMIKIGNDGASERKFGKEDDFIEDMTELGGFTSFFVDRALKLANKEIDTKLPPENLVIRLS